MAYVEPCDLCRSSSAGYAKRCTERLQLQLTRNDVIMKSIELELAIDATAGLPMCSTFWNTRPRLQYSMVAVSYTHDFTVHAAAAGMPPVTVRRTLNLVERKDLPGKAPCFNSAIVGVSDLTGKEEVTVNFFVPSRLSVAKVRELVDPAVRTAYTSSRKFHEDARRLFTNVDPLERGFIWKGSPCLLMRTCEVWG